MINAQQVAGAINDPEFYNSPLVWCAWKILLIRGGACYEIEDLQKIKSLRR
jgi:threonine aldolase